MTSHHKTHLYEHKLTYIAVLYAVRQFMCYKSVICTPNGIFCFSLCQQIPSVFGIMVTCSCAHLYRQLIEIQHLETILHTSQQCCTLTQTSVGYIVYDNGTQDLSTIEINIQY